MGFGPEGLARLTVLAYILTLVDVALFIHLFKDLLNGGYVIIVGGADETVVADVHQLPQILDSLGTLHDAVYELLGSNAGLLGLVLDFLAVFICTCEEQDLIAGQPLIAGHGVGGYGAVGVADVQLIAGIVDGCGDIKTLFIHSKAASNLSCYSSSGMELSSRSAPEGIRSPAGKELLDSSAYP